MGSTAPGISFPFLGKMHPSDSLCRLKVPGFTGVRFSVVGLWFNFFFTMVIKFLVFFRFCVIIVCYSYITCELGCYKCSIDLI